MIQFTFKQGYCPRQFSFQHLRTHTVQGTESLKNISMRVSEHNFFTLYFYPFKSFFSFWPIYEIQMLSQPFLVFRFFSQDPTQLWELLFQGTQQTCERWSSSQMGPNYIVYHPEKTIPSMQLCFTAPCLGDGFPSGTWKLISVNGKLNTGQTWN